MLQNSLINENGVVMNPTIEINHKDKVCEFQITKGIIDGKEYFSYSVTAYAFGIYSGEYRCLSDSSYHSFDECIIQIENFLFEKYKFNENGIAHLKKLEVFRKEKQLALFE